MNQKLLALFIIVLNDNVKAGDHREAHHGNRSQYTQHNKFNVHSERYFKYFFSADNVKIGTKAYLSGSLTFLIGGNLATYSGIKISSIDV